MNLNFDIFNGEQIASGKNLFSSYNRAFRYGDGLFETIRVSAGKPLFLKEHIARLKKGLRVLHLNWPTTNPEFDITKSIERLIQESNCQNIRLRLTVFRDTTGFYQPATDNCSWHLSGEKLDSPHYSVSSKGISMGLFRDELKTTGNLSNCKTLNSLIYILAGIEARNGNYDDMFMLNINQNILETINANIFIRTEQSFTTPPLLDGCIDGVMRKTVLQLFRKNGIAVVEKSITEHELMLCDEMILTNVISGVKWVSFYNEKSYQNTFSGIITNWLNETLKS
jgi:branched-chain amino acid aminotransferase